jgi:F420-dependent oxidoreductase-like protein
VDVRIAAEPHFGATYDDQLALAQVAERVGFDGFFRADHFLTTDGGTGLPGPTDSWVTLGALARETHRIRLGTMVTSATFRAPALLAVSAAQVDQMSGGRLEVGIGAGWFEGEHVAYGFPYPTDSVERFARFEEYLEILTGLWNTPVGETFSYDGTYHRLRDCPALPKPLQLPLPIVIGGRGHSRTPALAARFASEFNNAYRDPDLARAQYGRVRAACEAIGRDPTEIVMSHWMPIFCSTDGREAHRRAAASHVSPAEVELAAVGTPEQVVERLREWETIGASRMYLEVIDIHDLEQIELVGAEVIPHVSEGS